MAMKKRQGDIRLQDNQDVMKHPELGNIVEHSETLKTKKTHLLCLVQDRNPQESKLKLSQVGSIEVTVTCPAVTSHFYWVAGDFGVCGGALHYIQGWITMSTA